MSLPSLNATSRRVLILGAQGRFGRAATQAFASAGWQVLAVTRRPLAAPPPGVQSLCVALRPGDPAGLQALRAAAEGVTLVVHALNPRYTRWPQELLPLARLGMDLAEQLGARFLLPGNVYHYGSGLPARLREDTPAQPDTRKGRLRAALEQELQQRCAAGRLRATVLRAGDFLGEDRGGWIDLLIARQLGRGRLAYPGPLDQPHAWTWLPDLAGTAVLLAERDLNGSTPAWQSWQHPSLNPSGAELLAAIERVSTIHVARPVGRGLWWPLLRALGWAVPLWRELAEMAYLWQRPHALDGGALQQALGPALPQTSLDEALRRNLAALDLLPATARPAPPARIALR